MADSGTKDFGSILSGGLYRIPNYQRGYAWTNKEVNDLIDDLEYVTDDESIEDHYLNSVVVAEKQGETSTDTSDVIDGQQRLLTASLLANEILRKASELYTGGICLAEQPNRNRSSQGRAGRTAANRAFRA